jgi:hypothetical protein
VKGERVNDNVRAAVELAIYLFGSLQRVATIENVAFREEHRLVVVVIKFNLLLIVDKAVAKRVRLADSLRWAFAPKWILKFGDDERRWNT